VIKFVSDLRQVSGFLWIQHYVIKFVSDLRQVSGFLWIQHYVIKFVSDLRHVSAFLRIIQFPPPINLLDLQLPVQLRTVTTNVVSSNPAHGEMYSKQHYVIEFVSDLRQVRGILRVL
jgi:hypothetical protein